MAGVNFDRKFNLLLFFFQSLIGVKREGIFVCVFEPPFLSFLLDCFHTIFLIFILFAITIIFSLVFCVYKTYTIMCLLTLTIIAV